MAKSEASRRAGTKRPALPEMLPDCAAMEAFLKRMGRKRAEKATEAAQQFMYDAWEAESESRAIVALYAALEISPLCADAYLYLMPVMVGPERLDLAQRAVRAAELALGPKTFKALEGEFWGCLETRPYMRARHHLGLELDSAGRPAEAAEVYVDMLRLNPNDNQGVRYLLLDLLILLGRHEEAAELIKQYVNDGAAHWLYDVALLAFRTGGDGPAAREARFEALAQNPHAPAYLLGRKRIPKDLPEYIGWGDASEAAAYAHHCRRLWRATPGALDWLAAGVEPPQPRARKRNVRKYDA